MLVRAITRVSVSAVTVIVAYFVAPAAGRSGTLTVALVLICLLVYAGMIVWQFWRITQARYPNLRAGEAIGVALPALIVLFAYTYLSLSHADMSNFSEPLDHISALYFTLSTISTVGFGDIVARTDLARVIVMLQIVTDLALVFGIGRAIFFAARVGRSRQQGQSRADG